MNFKCTFSDHDKYFMRRSRGEDDRGVITHLENHKWLYVHQNAGIDPSSTSRSEGGPQASL